MDEEEIKEALKEFPSTLDFDGKHMLSHEQVSELIHKLQQDDQDTVKTKEEKIKIYNFLSYLHYLQRKIEEAENYCQKSLTLDPNNLTANANICHYFLKTDDIAGAQDVIELLLEMKTRKESFEKNKTYAKADLAYAYSRAGPRYHGSAEELFDWVIQKYSTEYNWKFGLGLTLIRQTHIGNTVKKDARQSIEQMLSKALSLLFDVIQHTTDKQLCGKAWVEIGRSLYSNTKSGINVQIPEKLHDKEPRYCFEKALEICPDEPYVLQHAGKHFRYFNELKKSEDLLRKSIKHHKTCFAYHHLALTLKRKVEMESNPRIIPRALSFPIDDNPSSTATSASHRKNQHLDYGITKRFDELSLGDQSFRPDNRQRSTAQFFIPRVEFRNPSPGKADEEFPRKCNSPMSDQPLQEYESGYYSLQVNESETTLENISESKQAPKSKEQKLTQRDVDSESQVFYSQNDSIPLDDSNQERAVAVGGRFSSFELARSEENDQHTPLPNTQHYPPQVVLEGEGYACQTPPGHSSCIRPYAGRRHCQRYGSVRNKVMGRQNQHSTMDYYRPDPIDGNERSTFAMKHQSYKQNSQFRPSARGYGRRNVRRPRGNRRRTTGRLPGSEYQRSLSESHLPKMIKSPSKVKTYPGNTTLLEAVELLKKAEEISNGAEITYELALTYRMLNLPEEAHDTLKTLLAQEWKILNKVGLAKIYEQKGNCLLDLSKNSTESKEKKKYKENGKAALLKAIEQQAVLINEDKAFKTVWKSYPTLKSLLSENSDLKSMRNLAKIHKMMNEHEQAIEILEHIEKSDGSLGIKDHMDLVENHVKLNHFPEALTLLKLIEYTDQVTHISKPPYKQLLVKAYILGALQSIREGDIPIAQTRFRSLYNINRYLIKLENFFSPEERLSFIQFMQKERKADDGKEIHIVHRCSSGDECQTPSKFNCILTKYTNLKVTINTEDSLGEPIFTAMVSTMSASEHILVISSSGKKEDLEPDLLNNNYALRNAKKLVVISEEKCRIPEILDVTCIPCIRLPPGYINCNESRLQDVEGAEGPTNTNDEFHLKFLKEMFEALCQQKI